MVSKTPASLSGGPSQNKKEVEGSIRKYKGEKGK